MSLEPGGRADKRGNSYENRFLAKLLLRLVEEKIASIEVEPLGVDGVGIEFITTDSSGVRTFYQCKSSSADSSYWTYGSLSKYNVFFNAKTQLDRDSNNIYKFISPLTYEELDELCERARMNHSAQDFFEHQISNRKQRDWIVNLSNHLNLHKEVSSEATYFKDFLSRCYFETFPFGNEIVWDLESQTSRWFSGTASAALELLENCINDNSWYGQLITADRIRTYMEANGFPSRNYGADDRVLSKIRVINDTYWDKYVPINGVLFPRKENDILLKHVKEGRSVILHGKAGSGKSGCIEALIDSLEQEQILHLQIKLDKYAPKTTADQYGRDLGLPESPVYALHKIAAGNPCVLILDQLDALRWTSMHSAAALAVCKEMISQVAAINRYEKGPISLVFVSRTFDYKNDAGIRALFSNSVDDNWKEISLGLLSQSDVKAITGDAYTKLSPRIKNILETPSSLYVWSQLNEKIVCSAISSANMLMERWWTQILQQCTILSLTQEDVISFISDFARTLGSRELFSLPRTLFSGKSILIDTLISQGLINEKDGKIFFVHQSFLDYFLAHESVKKVLLDRKRLVNLIGNQDSQTPNLRYRFLSILHGIAESDMSVFVEEAELILASDNVRYYYKCAVFEALAQHDPDINACNFSEKYYGDTVWHEYVFKTVYLFNPKYAKTLNNKIDWFGDEGLRLLRSISDLEPDFVVEKLSPFSLKNSEDDQKIYSCLCRDIHDDSDAMYNLRMQILRTQPSILPEVWLSFYDAFNTEPLRCIVFLASLLSRHRDERVKHVHLPDIHHLRAFYTNNAEPIVSTLFPLICNITFGLTKDYAKLRYSDEYLNWCHYGLGENCLYDIKTIIKESVRVLASEKPSYILELIKDEKYSDALVGNELLLAGIESLSIKYADDVLKWLLDQFPKHIFDYTGDSQNLLTTVTHILSKFSPCCSTDIFCSLEGRIYYWKESAVKMVEIYQCRTQDNHDHCGPVYYSYWGHMQKELLPALDQNRVSARVKELIMVLNRNAWISIGHYRGHFVSEPAKSVVSPINSYAGKLSNKAWLRIITTPAVEMTDHYIKERKDSFVEVSHDAFSTAFGIAAKQDCNRFSEFMLQMPENCYVGYILEGLRALSQRSEDIDLDLLQAVCEKYILHSEISVRSAVCDILQEYAEYHWSEKVLIGLRTLASTPYSLPDGFKKHDTVSETGLYTIVLNTPPGRAMEAIMALLWKQPHLIEFFKPSIVVAASHTDAYMRFAAVDCAVTCYNNDRYFTCSVFRTVLKEDLSILLARQAWQILYRDYSDNSVFYRKALVQACESSESELAKRAAEFICALAIFYNDYPLTRYIGLASHSAIVVRSFAAQAVSSFNSAEYQSQSKEILLKLSVVNNISLNVFKRSFFNDQFSPKRDSDFINTVLCRNISEDEMLSFLTYLSEHDIDLVTFVDIIQNVAKRISDIAEQYKRTRATELLTKCLVALFDKGSKDSYIRKICLDIWDSLFKSSTSYIKSLTEMLDMLI